jgi:hypothetical protein
MRNCERLKLPALVFAALFSTVPAVHANSISADGLTYTLTDYAVNSSTEAFILDITGINAATDTENGRSGVVSLSFNKPANFLSATLTGFSYMDGGLDAGGCNGNGASFFCFNNNATLSTTPALGVNSSLQFVFQETISSGNFVGYSPDFKITWIGSKSNYNGPHDTFQSGYDLVSTSLTPSACIVGVYPCPGSTNPTPLPGALPLFAGGLGLVGLLGWRRKKKAASLVAA